MGDGRMPNSGAKPPPPPPKPRRTKPNTYAPAFPPPQPPPPNSFPTTPSYEAGQRGLTDSYTAQQQNLNNQIAGIAPQVDLQNARIGTDMGYANQQLDTSLVDRGIYDSGANPYLRTRDVLTPYGRQQQDLANWAGNQYSTLDSALGANELAYNQSMAELMLNNASTLASDVPMNVPQYSTGRRNVNQKPPKKNNKPPKNGGK